MSEYRRPTPAQDAARKRNFKIRCLRSVWAQAGWLSPARAKLVRDVIDDELTMLGAEREAVRREPIE